MVCLNFQHLHHPSVSHKSHFCANIVVYYLARPHQMQPLSDAKCIRNSLESSFSWLWTTNHSEPVAKSHTSCMKVLCYNNLKVPHTDSLESKICLWSIHLWSVTCYKDVNTHKRNHISVWAACFRPQNAMSSSLLGTTWRLNVTHTGSHLNGVLYPNFPLTILTKLAYLAQKSW